jgi:hypothetical protein
MCIDATNDRENEYRFFLFEEGGLCQVLFCTLWIFNTMPMEKWRVDLQLQCGDKTGVIEVKSSKSQAKRKNAQTQAAGYAKPLKMLTIAIAVFVPVSDDAI